MLPAALYHLYFIRTSLEETLNQIPDGVKPATVPVANPDQSEQAAKELEDLLLQANELNGEVELLYEKQFGHSFDIRYELPDEDD